MSSPGLAVTAIFVLILSWNEFAFAFIITSRNAKTLPPSALTFMTEAQTAWNEVGDAAIVISISVILSAILVQKHLVRVLAMGAIKEWQSSKVLIWLLGEIRINIEVIK